MRIQRNGRISSDHRGMLIQQIYQIEEPRCASSDTLGGWRCYRVRFLGASVRHRRILRELYPQKDPILRNHLERSCSCACTNHLRVPFHHPSTENMNIDNALDKAVEGLALSELINEPPSSLQGLAERVDEPLKQVSPTSGRGVLLSAAHNQYLKAKNFCLTNFYFFSHVF